MFTLFPAPWCIELTAAYTAKAKKQLADRAKIVGLSLPALCAEPLVATFSIDGTGSATIDWGDGSVEKVRLTQDESLLCKHVYTGQEAAPIRIKGTSGAIETLELYIGKERAGTRHCHYTSLRLEGCTQLAWLDCSYNELETLDISGCPRLKIFACNQNRLSTLDISRNPALTYLTCSGNRLDRLDLSPCDRLETLHCEDNRLSELDITPCAQLKEVCCGNNRLTALRIGGHPQLKALWCSKNRLSSLEVGGCPALKELYCNDNRLPALDLGGNRRIAALSCEHNRLSVLNIGKNQLKQLACSSNRLTGLDLSRDKKLTHLRCDYNSFSTEATEQIYRDLPTWPADSPKEPVICVDEERAGDYAIAEAKGWRVARFRDGVSVDYRKE